MLKISRKNICYLDQNNWHASVHHWAFSSDIFNHLLNARLCNSSLIVFQIVWLTLSHWLFPVRWYEEERLEAIPRSARNALKSQLMNDAPRSLRKQDGKPNKQNKLLRESITVADDVEEQGKTKGYRLYSSTMMRR